jgi:hypothetical protein
MNMEGEGTRSTLRTRRTSIEGRRPLPKEQWLFCSA